MQNVQKKTIWMILIQDFLMLAIAALSAFSYTVFVFPNQFAPSGINGLATMIQYLLNFKVSYMALLINVPLCIVAFCRLDRTFARRTLIYALSFSLFLLLFGKIDMSRFVYKDDNSSLLAPLTAGIIYGFIYGSSIRLGGSTGGTDVIAALIHRVKPRYPTVWILFALNAGVASLSYFVYDFKLEPVLLCIIYCFMSSAVSNAILRGSKEAIKFEVVTSRADEISQLIMDSMHHSCTFLSGTGAYTHTNKTLLICVIHKDQIPIMMNILHRFPETFAYITPVTETVGRFVHVRERDIARAYLSEEPLEKVGRK